MRAFILAAGFGTRLKPITDTVPKALVPVCGEPLLAHNLRRLHNSGVFSAIGVNSHYLHDQMEQFRRGSSIPFELFYEKDKIRGTGGALDFARDFLGGDDTFMVANVDILHKFDIPALAEHFINANRICSLVSIPAGTGGTILYDDSTGDYLGVIADREEVELKYAAGTGSKIAPPVVIKEAEFTGVTFYRREFLGLVNGDDFSVTAIWKRVSAQDYRYIPGIILPKRASSWWMDIGTHEALAEIQEDVKNGKVDLWN
ncbi:MAG: sugar phosphate nucleotidyltransferase [Chitinispirillia bacterium]|nr:sugar phosphate nucleotidyltransferase [Chitinispirillia bacterium]MCL2241635.1 sugar phosphate nucleotidyltransferase [Chitinispirillia bacterium]